MDPLVKRIIEAPNVAAVAVLIRREWSETTLQAAWQACRDRGLQDHCNVITSRLSYIRSH